MSTPTNPRDAKTLLACCGAHAVQDGLVALQFVLLPILAVTFGLNYTQVGLLRGVSNTAMALLELPSGILAERYGERRLLAVGLVAAGLGYVGVAFSAHFWLIALFFLLAGAGAGFQHSLSSSVLVKHFDGPARRRALGVYNSAGDGGKLAYTGIFSAFVGMGVGWNWVVTMLAIAAVLFGAVILGLLRAGTSSADPRDEPARAAAGWGVLQPRRFALLATAVFVDSTVQAVFLTFLAFLFIAKGANDAVAASAVVIALAGGMVGKFGCGYLAARLGDRTTFVLIQLLKAVGLIALIVLPMVPLLFVLPLIGLVVQGSSTVTYGAVGDFVAEGRQSRGYALIYSMGTGSSIAGPFLFGMIADGSSLAVSMWALTALALLTIPLGAVLSGPTHAQVVVSNQ